MWFSTSVSSVTPCQERLLWTMPGIVSHNLNDTGRNYDDEHMHTPYTVGEGGGEGLLLTAASTMKRYLRKTALSDAPVDTVKC